MTQDIPCNKYQGEVPLTVAFGMDRVMVELRHGADKENVGDVLNGMNETRRNVLRQFCNVLTEALDVFEEDEPTRDVRAPMCGFPATAHDYKLEPHHRG
jgi:hypothetical protein